MQYAGGGLVSVSGKVGLEMSEFHIELRSISARGQGSAFQSMETVVGGFVSLDATGYVGTKAVDSIGFDVSISYN